MYVYLSVLTDRREDDLLYKHIEQRVLRVNQPINHLAASDNSDITSEKVAREELPLLIGCHKWFIVGMPA